MRLGAGRCCGGRFWGWKALLVQRRDLLRLHGCGGLPCVSGATKTQELIDLGLIRQIALAEMSGDPAAFKHQYPVGQICDKIKVLLHQQDRESALFAQKQQGLGHLFNDRGLDAFRWLVQQQEFR
ncbi:hypothetical protein SULPSESMR1_04533 (plasmid) [Pseudosulfitobacter pseudonitzschiae]|uniref:Uncharacterized protein n=1 Tax=Pseudosulfitobacter pseudonitzschiae TaxID=1402135 RepID=A0A221K8B0_9RHOB|nr:hypothetical protein SULPSESMR1_04533 [Pseudosulfitobacter pseudonitzschiae]